MKSDNPISDSPNPGDSPSNRIAFHNDRWINANTATLSVLDPAVTQGVTAVERIRAYNGSLFQLDRHLHRWQRTINALTIQGLPSSDDLSARINELIGRNQHWITGQDAFGVVMFATPGLGGTPTLVIDLYSIDLQTIANRIEAGSPIVITDVVQPPNASWSRNIKVRSRLHYYLADRVAHQSNTAAIGILVDSDGTVTESGIANLLIVEDGQIVSPLPKQILTGVSLQVIKDLAEQAQLPWLEQRIAPQRVRAADEVLLTGTSCGIWFASSIDGSESLAPGPVYKQLRSAFDQFVADNT